jgi:hypothetical protein
MPSLGQPLLGTFYELFHLILTITKKVRIIILTLQRRDLMPSSQVESKAGGLIPKSYRVDFLTKRINQDAGTEMEHLGL